MNWTGGRLSRHSRNAKGGVTAKQKEHFAKVRSAQQGVSSKMSPIKWSVFNQIADPNANQPQTKVSRRFRHVDNFHHEVDNTPDLFAQDSVHRTRRGTKRAHASSREISQEHIYSSQTNNTPQLEAIRRFKQDLHEIAGFRADSSHFRSIPKQKPNAESATTEQEHDGHTQIEKKRKILLQRDWFATSFQRPSELNYAPPETIEKIGRRRKVSGGHRARFEHRHREIPAESKAKVHTKDSGKALARNSDVRISIGGKEIRVGVSSSSGLGKTPLDHVRNSTEKASSDVMLLDHEDTDRNYVASKNHTYDGRLGSISIGKQPVTIPTLAKTLQFQCSPSGLSNIQYPYNSHEGRELSFTGPNFDRKTHSRVPSNNSSNGRSIKSRKVPSSHSRRTLSTSEIRELYHNFRDQPESTRSFKATPDHYIGRLIPNLSLKHHNPSFGDIINGSGRNSRAASSDIFTLLSFVEGHGNGRDPAIKDMECRSASRLHTLRSREIASQSPPLIQHPVPQSSRTSQLLRSEVSDEDLSIAVQTGKVEHNSREIDDLDEEVWKSWVLPKDVSVNQSDGDEASESEKVSLTPGISTYDTGLKHAPRQSSSPAEDNFTEQHNFIETNTNNIYSETVNDQSALQLHNELNSYLHQNEADYKEEREIEEDFTAPASTQAPVAKKVKTSIDENSIWQKFVFTSDSDGEEESNAAPQVSARKLFATQHSEDSSMLAHRSTDTDEPPQQRFSLARAELRQSEGESSVFESRVNARTSIGATQGTQLEMESSAPESIINTHVSINATQGTTMGRESSTSESAMNDRMSYGATQGSRAELSPSILETTRRVPNDTHTNLAMQGYQHSSPDILSTGTPLINSSSYLKSTQLQSVLEKHTPLARKRKIVFTKPKPFVGKKSAVDAESAPLRIGKKKARNNGAERASEARRRKVVSDDIYESGSDDEVESIEDY